MSANVCSDNSSETQWSHVGSQLEGELSVKVLTLTVDENKGCSEGSFTSEPDSCYNNGALKFLDLVEATLARQAEDDRSKLFEDLLVQMTLPHL